MSAASAAAARMAPPPHSPIQARTILHEQRDRYEGTFYVKNRWRWIFRDDCRYRWHRLREALNHFGISPLRQTVLEVGFGSGDLLFQFPSSCTLMGIELSADAVRAIEEDPRLAFFADHWFASVTASGALPRPDRLADILLTSHVLEHAPDDRALLAEALPALRPGGLVITFVPLEPPGFDPKHVRTYSVRKVCELMEGLGLELLHVETNYSINAVPLRWMDHPARHGWPLLKGLEAVRNVMMTLVPYRVSRGLEEVLANLGARPTQVMAIASKP